MSEHGFQVEGLLRSLQPSLAAGAALIFVVVLAWLALRWTLARRPLQEGARRAWRRRADAGAVLLVLLILAVIALQAVGLAASNRLPRSDTDKSDVYRQMAAHRGNAP